MNKYLGIILLVAAMAMVFYVVNNFSKFKFLEFPSPASAPQKTSAPSSNLSSPEIREPSKTSTPPVPPQGFKLEELSPYYKKVRISSISASAYYNHPSQISLNTTYDLNEKINISGWRVKSNRGDFIIPKAIEVYDPFGFSEPNDINLDKAQRVYIYSSYSAFGRNFRLNKCVGHLENTYDFNPPLPRNCPRISRSGMYQLKGTCQNYLMSLSSCEAPDPNNTIVAWDEKCRQFVEQMNINYKGCFDSHRMDPDFL